MITTNISLPHIAIISFSAIQRDARVLRQVEALSQHFLITVIGYGQLDRFKSDRIQMRPVPQPQGVMRHLRALILLLLGRLFPGWAYETWYWDKANHRLAYEWLLQSKAQAIHANEWNALPLAAKAAHQTGACLVADLHEYSPLEGEDRWYWRVLYQPAINYILRRYMPYASASITVNETIAAKYASEYGFRPMVVMNVPRCTHLPNFKPTDPAHIRLIHHGMAVRDRQLELMIQTIASADSRYTLHFMLLGDEVYIARLQALAQRLAPERVFFHPPVSPAEIVPRLAEFDLGFYPLPFSHNFNNSVALPNKFFDFITAGLAVCLGPSPEMARLTQQFGFGVVAPTLEPQAIANRLNHLTAPEIDGMKLKAIEARKILNADTELGKLTNVYAQLLETR